MLAWLFCGKSIESILFLCGDGVIDANPLNPFDAWGVGVPTLLVVVWANVLVCAGVGELTPSMDADRAGLSARGIKGLLYEVGSAFNGNRWLSPAVSATDVTPAAAAPTLPFTDEVAPPIMDADGGVVVVVVFEGVKCFRRASRT